MQIRVLMKPGRPGGIASPVDEPVTFGVPLARGISPADGRWTLRTTAGDRRLVQTRTLDRWADGSVRWMLVDATISAESSAATEYVLEPSHDHEVLPGISVAGGTNDVTVDTGMTRFEIRSGSHFPFARLETPSGDSLLTDASLVLTDATGSQHRPHLTPVTVEERGPLRTVVGLAGSIDAGQGRTLALSARLHFYAASPVVRVRLTVTNTRRAQHRGGFWDLGDSGSILIKDLSVSLAMTRQSVVRLSAEADLPLELVNGDVELYQDSSGGENWQSTNHLNRERRVPTSFRGYRVRTGGGERQGLRATPLLEAHGLGISVPEFWENFPRALEVSGSAATVRFFPGQFSDLHEIQGGEQKTLEFYVSAGGAESLAWTRARSIACVHPEDVLASAAIPFLAPLTTEHAALVQSAVEGVESFAAKREIIDEYGWRHYGELYGDHESVRQQNPPIVSHYNNQYDALAGFIYQFLRTADPRWWQMAGALAGHVIDIDVYHTTEDKAAYNHGLFWHTYHYGDADLSTHRTYPAAGRGKTFGGGPSADHNYTTGLMLYWFLSGDEAARTTAIELGQFVIDMDDGGQTIFRWLDRGSTGRAILSATGYFGPGRGPANSLNALVDAYRLTGDDRFRGKAEEIVRRVVHPRQDIPALRLDTPELRWFYTMFLQSLGKYIHSCVERGALDGAYAYARASLLHFARYMAQHEHPYLEKPEKLEFPTETWAAQDIRKSDVFFYAAINASGDERQLFVDKGEFFHQYSTSTLAADPRRHLLRPVVILLTSGFMFGWRKLHPAYAEPDGPALTTVGDPEAFVPQRTRAERRAKQLAGAAAVLALAVVAVLLSR